MEQLSFISDEHINKTFFKEKRKPAPVPKRPNSYYENKEEAQVMFNFGEIDGDMYYGDWIVTSPYDTSLQVLADRHYTRQTKGSPHISRPGYKVALRTSDGKAGWLSWNGIRDDGLEDVWECSLYRNESKRKYLSSTMIKFGVYGTICEWLKKGFQLPKNGFITYVDPTKVDDKTEAGYSYRKAGFKEIGKSKKGKLLFYIDLHDNCLTILELQWIEYFRYIQKVIQYLLNSNTNEIYYLAAFRSEAIRAEEEIQGIRDEMVKRGLEEALYTFKSLYILNDDDMNHMIDTINDLRGEGTIEELADMFPLHELYLETKLIKKWDF